MRWALAAFLSLIMIAGLSGCGTTSPSATQSIVVFAAASLRPAFTEIAEQFRTDNPGTRVDFDFAGSSELATRLTQGATADVFASADTAQMETVVEAGLTAGNPVNFASNTLVIVTPPGNPTHIRSFADLARPALKLVVCQQPVPCGSATKRIADTTGVHLDPVSEEPAVSDVLTKITSGEADAGLVYVTDALNAGDTVAMITFPEAAGAANVYPIAVLKRSSEPGLAQKFIDLLTGEPGQKVLDRAGFAKA